MGAVGALVLGGVFFLLGWGVLVIYRGTEKRVSSSSAAEPQGAGTFLCRSLGHAWRRVLVGQGRDVRYVVKCSRCEAHQDEV